MKTQKTNTATFEDTVAKDFRAAIVVVSLLANLTVFVAWVTLMVTSVGA